MKATLSFRSLRLSLATTALLALVPIGTYAQDAAMGPGVGRNATLEVKFLKMIIDHHYSALRITELAAGTDTVRSAAIDNPGEGVANTPGFAATASKSQIDAVKSMARRDNAAQREEIVTAQNYLKDWYHISYKPTLTTMGKAQIAELTAVGRTRFDKRFLELFSEHHFLATVMADACLVGHDQHHMDLHRYCEGILSSQLKDIDEMRELLCTHFNECDWQPENMVEGLLNP